jgi:hypothetical protein
MLAYAEVPDSQDVEIAVGAPSVVTQFGREERNSELLIRA